MPNNKRWSVIPVLLLIGIIYHLVIGAERIVFDIKETYNTIGQHALWRGMRFHRSESLANSILFFNEVIPNDAVVMLPPNDTIPKTLATFPTMQFFLNLRELIPCQEAYEVCIGHYEGEHVYILLVGNQTKLIRDLDISNNRLVMHDDNLGVIIPSDGKIGSNHQLESFGSRLEIFTLMILPICFLLVFIATGYFILNTFLPEESFIFKLASGYGFSLGFFSLLIYLFLLLNGGILTVTLIWAALLGLIVFTFIPILFQSRKKGFHIRFKPTKWKFDIWVVLLIAYLILQVCVSLGRAYCSSDDIDIWGVKGYSIAKYGLSTGLQEWGTKTTKYTLNNPILIATFRVLFSERVPESKLISPAYAFMLLLIMYDYLRQKTPDSIAGLSTMFIATVPIIYRHANKAYANIIVSYYLLVVFILAFKTLEKKGIYQKRYMLLIGPFLVLAAWSRPEAVIISGMVLVYLSFLLIRNGYGKEKHKNELGWVFFAYSIFTIFWGITSKWVYADSVKDSGLFHQFINQIAKGNLYIERVGQIIERLSFYYFNKDNWGALGIMILFLLIIVYSSRKSVIRVTEKVAGGGIYIMMIVCVYYSTLFIKGPSLSWWLSTGLTRMIMPGMIILWLAVVSSLHTNISVQSPINE